MSSTGVTICNSAILLIGGEEIESFDDGSVEAKVASQLYGVARDALLTETDWTFATGQAQLDRKVQAPIHTYEYAYQLPTNLLSLSSVNPASIDYDLYENSLLYTDYLGEVYIDYKFRPAEARFPAYFEQYLILNLASLFAVPVTEDATKADYYAARADVQGKKARLVDARQRKNRGLKRFPLILARG